MYNTKWPTWSTFRWHRPLVASSCSCFYGSQTRFQYLKVVGSMYLVGASLVHSSNSDGLIRDMLVIADLNITSVSEIQDTPMSPWKLSQMLWMVASQLYGLLCQLLTITTMLKLWGFQWTIQIGGFTQVLWAFTMMDVIWYYHQLPISLNTAYNDS